MEKILVTSVGGGVGQSIVKSLQNTEYGIVGVDSEELAAGLYSVPSAYKGKYAVDSHFADRLIEICRIEKCSLIFPGLDIELLPLSENSERFRAKGIIPVVSTPEVIRICDNKLETNLFLRRFGFPAPETCRFKDITTPHYPVVLKPQTGGAQSKNTYVIHTPEEMEIYRPLIDPDNCIVQEHIESDEYTCGTITFEGKCAGVIIMRRTLRAGDTYKAFVERNKRMEEIVREIVEQLKPFGPCNVQLRVKNGEPHVFEINARCSGTTAARTLAGFNEPKMTADYLLHGIKPDYSVREISILRYWKELAVSNEQIDRLAKTEHITGSGPGL
jgi:carbamoyl-phosphate synthase large subunit